MLWSEGTLQQRVAAENRQRVERVARDLILVERNAGSEARREPRQRTRINAPASPHHEIGDEEEDEKEADIIVEEVLTGLGLGIQSKVFIFFSSIYI